MKNVRASMTSRPGQCRAISAMDDAPAARARLRRILSRLAVGAVLASIVTIVVPASATGGSQVWVARYNGRANFDDYAYAQDVSRGRVFVTGFSRGTMNGDYATVGYDASSGRHLWASRYNAGGEDSPNAIDVSRGGALVFVTGLSEEVGEDADSTTVAYDASSGDVRWVKRYSGPRNQWDAGKALGASPDGSKVFVAIESTGSDGGYDYNYVTVAYDAFSGRRLWVKRYDGPGGRGDSPIALAVSPDGRQVFVTGESRAPMNRTDYATIAYRASTGAKLWVARYNGPASGSDAATALGVTPDGSTVVVTGRAAVAARDVDYATVAYDATTGRELWARRYDSGGYDYTNSLAVSPNGSEVFITGQSTGRTQHWAYGTIAYDAPSGARLWTRRYTGPRQGDDSAVDIGVARDGSEVFVTGTTGGSSGSRQDYATLAYDASSGARLWLKRFNGEDSRTDSAAALGVSRNGSMVFVTGQSQGSGTNFDFATVAYPS